MGRNEIYKSSCYEGLTIVPVNDVKIISCQHNKKLFNRNYCGVKVKKLKPHIQIYSQNVEKNSHTHIV